MSLVFICFITKTNLMPLVFLYKKQNSNNNYDAPVEKTKKGVNSKMYRGIVLFTPWLMWQSKLNQPN